MDPVASFLDAATVPLDRGHATGTLDQANAILARHPEVATSTIYCSAVLGDERAVRSFLAGNPGAATEKGGPREWDPLTYLCFSRYLRLDPDRSEGLVRTARALLDAGASANTGWTETHEPHPVWESALYGAAGIAHHPELTRLLLERGGDPNDGETPYHTPETYDNRALEVLVESGKLTADSLGMILLRKTDWHDLRAIEWLLERGVDPNRETGWGKTALHNALLSDNDLAIVEVLLDHGADPTIMATRPSRGSGPAARSSVSIAARRGRGDVLELFERRGVPIDLVGVERLLAACARDQEGAIRSIVEREPDLVPELISEGGLFLAEFAGVGNTAGVGRLLDLGVPVDAPYQGDGYFDIAPDSTALQVAAWRANHSTVKLMLERGAAVDRPDGKGRTPLALAVKACVDSYWSYRRSPESVAALLTAGASPAGIRIPTGYDEIDRLLAAL
jgi:ankyrin repeat protein